MNGEENEAEAHIDDQSTGAEETTAQVDVDKVEAIDSIEEFEASAAELLDEMESDGGESPDEEEDTGDEDENESDESEESDYQDNEPGEEAEEEEEDEPTNTKGKRFRVKVRDDVDVLAFELSKQNPELSYTECFRRANQASQKEVETTTAEVDEVEEPVERSVETVSTEIDDLNAEILTAMGDMDFVEAETLRQKVGKLQSEEFELRLKASQQTEQEATSEEAQWDSDVAQSESLALSAYPDVADPKSPLSREMVRLDQELKRLDDDLYYSANKPLKLAQMAARTKGIPPKIATKATSKKVRKTPPVLPGNGSRNTQNGPSRGKLEQMLDKVESVEDFDTLAAALLNS